MPLTPTPGSAAVAAGFSTVPGTGLASDLEEYINRLADEVATKALLIAGGAVTIAQGGTGGTTVSAAKTNLGFAGTDDLSYHISRQVHNYGADNNQVGARWELSRIVFRVDSTDVGQVAWMTDANARIARSGDSMSGELFLPNSSAASSGWTNAYINGDGRVCRGASSLRYKKHVSGFDPMALGNIYPDFYRFRMKADSSLDNGGSMPADSSWHFGHIVEEMVKNADQAPFVVWREINGEMLPDSIDENALAKAQIAQLHQRALTAEARIAELTDTVATLLARMPSLEGDTATSTPPPADPPVTLAPAAADDPKE